MSDFSSSWRLSRSRLLETIQGLSQNQLNWKIHPSGLSIGQMVLHVAGVEVYFSSQLGDIALDAETDRIRRAATEGVVNDGVFPFAEEEVDWALIKKSMDRAEVMVAPLIDSADETIRQKELVSALGPVITGEGAFARLGFHAAYHQGQAYLIKTAPGFPQA